MTRSTSDYIGRFAPSPTGPLHMGSLAAALASYLDSKAHRGSWLVRMEDIDPPREQAGASQTILHTLVAHGLRWDGDVLYQSQRHAVYENMLAQLITQDQIYPCICSRSELAASGPIYPGYCLNRDNRKKGQSAALRVKTTDLAIAFDDGVQGYCSTNLACEAGDFIVKRKDGFYAYQLATAVDDAQQRITHVVRGADLLDSTPRQIYLQQLLGYQPASYAHIPVLTDQHGQKLSKQNRAPALIDSNPVENLLHALSCLNQIPPPLTHQRGIPQLLQWAVTHWDLNRLPRQTELLHGHN